MITLILGLTVWALTCLGFIVHHMTRMKTMQTQYATHRTILNLVATNWLPSRKASYHAHIETTLIISILGGLEVFEDFYGYTQDRSMLLLGVFAFISAVALLYVSYRLWKNHRRLNRIWRECTESDTSN